MKNYTTNESRKFLKILKKTNEEEKLKMLKRMIKKYHIEETIK